MKLLIAFLLIFSLNGCAYNYQRHIATTTFLEPSKSTGDITDDEFMHRLSEALGKRFPAGTGIDMVIAHVKQLNGECNVETDRTKFPFGQYGPQRDLLICSFPEKAHMYAAPFLSSAIQINARIEDDKIQSMKAFRVTSHFP